MNGLGHADVESLLGAYALDAVDGDERDHVERHLLTCADCRRELDQYREVAGFLTTSEIPPPADIWEGISAAIAQATPATQAEATVTSLVGRLPRSFKMMAAATAVAAVAAGLLGVRVVGQERQLDRIQAASGADVLEQAARRAAADPAATSVELRSNTNSAAAEIAILPDGRGYALAGQLPAVGPDRTYQLWAMVDGQPISAAILGNRPTVATFQANGRITGFAITEEPAPGAVAPSTVPIVTGELRRA